MRYTKQIFVAVTQCDKQYLKKYSISLWRVTKEPEKKQMGAWNQVTLHDKGWIFFFKRWYLLQKAVKPLNLHDINKA